VARPTKERLLRDRAHLMGALNDYRNGKIPALPELELAAFLHGIERRLEGIERELSSIDAA
jgi:hypothetical protein